MKALRIALAFCFTLPLFAQTCFTFAGAEIDHPSSGTTTGLLRQSNGSYTAATITNRPPYMLVNIVPDFSQWIGSCISPPTDITLPSISASPAPTGVASQVGAFGTFTGGMFAAMTDTGSPEPKIGLAVL